MSSLALPRRSARPVLACSTALVVAALAFAAAAQQSFQVRLRPVPIEASTAANTTGAGDATASLAGTRLTLRGNFAGLKGAATAAVAGATAAEVRGRQHENVYDQIDDDTRQDYRVTSSSG